MSVNVSVDANCIISGSADLTIRVWDIKTQKCTKILSGHTGWVKSVICDVGGDRIISGGGDGLVKNVKNEKF